MRAAHILCAMFVSVQPALAAGAATSSVHGISFRSPQTVPARGRLARQLSRQPAATRSSGRVAPNPIAIPGASAVRGPRPQGVVGLGGPATIGAGHNATIGGAQPRRKF